MKIKDLKKWLSDVPDKYEVDIKMTFIFKGEEDTMEVLLDSKKNLMSTRVK